MRKILTIALLAVTMLAQAYEYRPLVVQGRVWNYQFYYAPDKAFASEDCTAQIVIAGDTIVDGKEYVKCWLRTDHSEFTVQSVPYFFLREDCEARQVWARLNSDYHYTMNDAAYCFIGTEEEYLLYDFANHEVHPYAFQSGRFYTGNYGEFQYLYSPPTFYSTEAVLADDTGREVQGYQASIGWLLEGIGFYGPAKGTGLYSNLFNITFQSRNPCGPYFSLRNVTDADGTILVDFTSRFMYAHPVDMSRSYKPMLVDGRMWRYREVNEIYNEEDPVNSYEVEEHLFDLKLQGTTEINGKQYAVIYAYYDNSPEPDQAKPFCYMRETSYGDIYLIPNKDYRYKGGYVCLLAEELEEINWMSLECPEYSSCRPDYVALPGNYVFSETAYTGPDGTTYAGYDLGRNGYVVEGLGMLTTWQPSSLMGMIMTFESWCNQGLPYLYSIVDADGTQLYHYAAHDPSGVQENSSDKSSKSVYFDLNGVKISGKPTNSGIYIRRNGAKSSKVIIK